MVGVEGAFMGSKKLFFTTNRHIYYTGLHGHIRRMTGGKGSSTIAVVSYTRFPVVRAYFLLHGRELKKQPISESMWDSLTFQWEAAAARVILSWGRPHHSWDGSSQRAHFWTRSVPDFQWVSEGGGEIIYTCIYICICIF